VASFFSGCLITNPVEFEQEEASPPFILDVSRSDNPIGSILEVNLDGNPRPSRIQIDVQVRDENLFQVLDARSRLVSFADPEPEYGAMVEIPEQGALLRDHTVFVEAGDLKQGECHVLELVVSGSFLEGNDRELFDVVSVPGDLARASWTIWEVSGLPFDDDTGAAAAQKLVKTCPTRDAVTVKGVEEPAP